MVPKSWPKRLTYARESDSVEVNLSFLRYYLYTGNVEDLHKNSWVIENKCVQPHLQIKKIIPSLKMSDGRFHPLANQKTLAGHPNYGVFAREKIKIDTEIGEYVGEMSINQEYNSPMACYSEYTWKIRVNNLVLFIDAQNIANELGLINDYLGLSVKPNLAMKPIIHKGFYYFGYVSICDIEKGEELLVDYGKAFQNMLGRKVH